MADGNDNGHGTMVVKLSWGVTIQVVLILVAIGIAWGTLTTRLNAVETLMQIIATSEQNKANDVNDLRSRLSELEQESRRRNR